MPIASVIRVKNFQKTTGKSNIEVWDLQKFQGREVGEGDLVKPEKNFHQGLRLGKISGSLPWGLF
jgi:hypothetical protein